jgi:MFS superfamily sulfate permease-like transporter
MLATVAVTVATHDLAQGVLVGVLLSGFFFAHKVGQILHIRSAAEDEGASAATPSAARCSSPRPTGFVAAFDFKEVIDKVASTSRAHFWDITAVSALDKVVLKFRREGTEVRSSASTRPAPRWSTGSPCTTRTVPATCVALATMASCSSIVRSSGRRIS